MMANMTWVVQYYLKQTTFMCICLIVVVVDDDDNVNIYYTESHIVSVAELVISHLRDNSSQVQKTACSVLGQCLPDMLEKDCAVSVHIKRFLINFFNCVSSLHSICVHCLMDRASRFPIWR